MGLFSKEQSYLGVDIGKGSIKIVELKNDNGRAKLLTYGFVEQNVEEVTEKDFINNPEYTGKIIKEICRKAQTKSTKVVAALPIFSVFNSILNLTNISKKELSNDKLLSSRVEWEAKKIVPLPLEEMILDWKLLSHNGDKNDNLKDGLIFNKKKDNKEIEKNKTDEESKDQGEKNDNKDDQGIIEEKIGGAKVLLTAAPKKLVQKYIDIFKVAGLELLSLETEAFALIRSLIGADKSPIIIVDSGAGRTSISIIDEGIPFLNRSIDVGGAIITKNLAKRLQIDVNKAEQFKIDLSAISGEAEEEKILEAIAATIAPIINEIRYSLNIYKKHEGQSARFVDKIIVTGGGAMLVNFVNHLKKELNMRVFVGDPWARVIYPEDLKPLLDELGPRFSVAIGLAMRDIE